MKDNDKRTSGARRRHRHIPWTWWFLISLLLLVTGTTFAPSTVDTRVWSRYDIWGVDRTLIKDVLSGQIMENKYPERISVLRGERETKSSVEYTLDQGLQDAVGSVFEKYRPDYGIFTALNPDTGQVLAMVSYRRDGVTADNLTLRNSYPAASVFKIITAAAALDLGLAEPTTVIPFNGKTTSLYRKNVLHHVDNQWTRRIPLSSAFAKSVNTVFARLGVFYLGASSLNHYAESFGFKKEFDTDFVIDPSLFALDSNDPWSIAETASGYTDGTTISPIHAASVAAVAINGGRLVTPRLVNRIVGEDGLVIYAAEEAKAVAIINPSVAEDLQILMRETVTQGSAKSSFKNFSPDTADQVEVGGKTGSLTGASPAGRYDWFVGYAKNDGRKIAFATLCINVDYWYVKSAYVARKALEHFFAKEA